MKNAGLDDSQAGIKKNINNIRYADDTTLMAESKEELRSLLMRVKEESEKAGLNKNASFVKRFIHSIKCDLSWSEGPRNHTE